VLIVVCRRFGSDICHATVRLIPPQFVKPYVKSNKNDANDAEAICEAICGVIMSILQRALK